MPGTDTVCTAAADFEMVSPRRQLRVMILANGSLAIGIRKNGFNSDILATKLEAIDGTKSRLSRFGAAYFNSNTTSRRRW